MTESASLFQRVLTRYELVPRRLAVTAVTQVAPQLMRVQLGGEALAGFASEGATDHVKVFFPNPSTGVLSTPADGDPAAVIARDFTPLLDADGGLNLDFFIHPDPGPAAAWAAGAAPGDEIVVGGPRGSRGLPAGADQFILVADETALPAASRWIAQISEGVPVVLIAAVHDQGDWVGDYLGGGTGLPETVVIRHSAPDAASVLAALAATGTITPTTYVWAAGDAGALLPVRRHLRRELALPKAQVQVDGYWRSGVVGWDHHAPVDPTDPD